MKKSLLLLIGILGFIGFSNAQYTYLTNYSVDAGNPGGVVTTDLTNSGTAILAGSLSANSWGSTYALPFAFDFYGVPVTQLKASGNGIITFDVAAVAIPSDTNTNLPATGTSNIPNQSIVAFWDSYSGAPPLGANDQVWADVFGTAPNRQVWISYYSYEYGTTTGTNAASSFNYWSIVLEETTNKIYIIDKSWNNAGPSLTTTVGVQENPTNAVQIGDSLTSLSANQGTSVTDNDVYEFTPLLLVADNAGIDAVNNPVNPISAGSLPVDVELKNWGTNALTSATINWTLNGVLQTPANFVGSIASLATTSVSLGSVVFPSGNSVIEVWSELPNGNADSDTSNDTIVYSICTSLSGVYTIGGAAGPTNYASFADASTDLMSCGISGPVTFNVAAGSYTDDIDLGAVVGSSAANTITFNGASAATTTITSTGNADNATISLDGTSYISFTNLTVENTKAGVDAWGLFMTNNCDFITVDMCDFVMPASTSADRACIQSSGSNIASFTSAASADNVSITNCDFDGGYYGIHLRGGTAFADFDNDILIDNNTFDTYFYGIYLDQITGLTISNNYIRTDATQANADGMSLFDIMNFDIVSNDILTRDWGISIQDANFDGAPVGRSTIINNMVISENDYGIYIDDAEEIDVFHNSARGVTAGFRVNDITGFDVRNNIFVNNSTSNFDYAYEDLDGLDASYLAFDYNVFNGEGTGTNLFDFGPSYADLPAFQTAEPTLNINSIEGDPVFLGANDLHLVGTIADNTGTPIASVTDDIDGDARSATTPDIGADEYAAPTCALPVIVGSSMINSASATVTWETTAGTGYILQWGLAGFTPETTFAGVSGGTTNWLLLGSPSDTTYSILDYNAAGGPATNPGAGANPLTGNTDYDWYVMSFCGGVVSPISAVNSFTTACDPFTAPYTQNFDLTTDPVFDVCWTGLEGFTNTTAEIIEAYNGNFFGGPVSPIGAFSAPNMIRMANSSGTNATGELIFVSPQFSDFGNDKRIRFMTYDDDNASDLIIGTMSDPNDATTFTAFQTITEASMTADVWEEQTISFASYVGTDQYVAFRHGANTTFDDLGIDDFVYEFIPSCPKPVALMSSMISSTTASLSWTSGGPDYFIEYGAPGFALGSGTLVPASTNPFVLTGLTPDTDYEWYVMDSCAVGDVSVWSNVGSFRTQCSPFTAPYTQNFDATIDPTYDACWSELLEFTNTTAEIVEAYNGNFFGGPVSPIGAFSAPNMIRMANSSGTNATGQMMFISPNFSDFGNDKRIRFMVYDDDLTSDLIIGTMSDPSNSATFTPFDTITFADMDNDVWEEFTVSFATYVGTDNYVAFRHGANNTFDDIGIDNFVYEFIPSCPKPTDLAASMITDNSASLSWTSGGPDYFIEYGAPGFAQGTGTIVSTSTNPFVLTGLTDNTEYDFYVMDSCAVADVSLWSNVGSFRTTCSPFTAPYTQNFDGTTDPVLDACWTPINELTNSTTELVHTYGGNFPAANSAPNSLHLQNSGGTIGDFIAVTPRFSDFGNDKRIKFWLHEADPNSDLYIGTMSDATDASTFTPYDTITSAQMTDDVWEEWIINFDTYVGTDQYVAFKHSTSTTFDDIHIDDFVYELIPTCPDVLGLTETGVSYTEMDVSWTASTFVGLAYYQIEYGLTGFAQGTGTMDTTSNTMYSLTGLTTGAEYDYYVSAVCIVGVDTSVWSSSNFIMGPCIPIYTTGKTAGDLISNVTVTGTTLDNFSGTAPTNPAYTYFTGAANLTGDMQAGSSYDVNVSVGTFPNQEIAVWIDFDDNLIFDNSERIGFVDNVAATPAVATFPVLLPCNPAPGAHRMRVRCVWNPAGGAVAIDPCASYAWGETEDYDVNVIPPNPCPDITGLVSSNVTAVSADLDWNQGCAETAWDIDVSTNPVPTTGTPGVVAHPDSSFTATLSPGTTYYAHVRANCGGGDVSDWSTVSFTSLSLPPSTYVWNGSAGDNDWSNPANWIGGFAPSTCAHDVYISDVPSIPIVASSFTCGDLTTDANSDVEIQLTGQINVCGDVILGGGFKASGTGSIHLTGAGGGSTIMTTGVNATISNLVVESNYSLPSGKLSITKSLELSTGDLTNAGGEVVLRSNVNATAYLDDWNGTGVYNGDITVKRYIPASSVGIGQRIFGSAVTSSPIGGLNPTYASGFPLGQVIPDVCNVSLAMGSPYSNLLEWNEDASFASGCEQSGWFAISAASTSLTPLRGYSGWVNDGNSITVTGPPNTGNVTYATTGVTPSIPMAQGWHVLSNPYPSPIAVSAFTNADFTSPQFYDGSSAFNGTTTPAVLAVNFASMQGFYAEYTGAGTGSLTTTNADRVASTSVSFVSSSTIFDQMLTINVHGNGFADRTFLYYSDDNTVTTGFDNYGDCKKRNSNAGQPTIYTSLGSQRMSLNGYPESSMGQSVPMGIDHSADGSFELGFEGMTNFPANTTIYVEDMQEGVYHNIANGNYAYTALASDNSDRFMIHFVLPIELATVNVNCAGDQGKIELVTTTGIVDRDFVITEATTTVATGALSTLNASVDAGTYDVTVNDAFGGNQTYTVTVEVDEAIEALYTVSAIDVQVGEVVSFNNTTLNTTGVEWNIADITTITGVNNATYSFDEVGTYVIELMVSNDDCSDVKTFEVNVSNKTTSVTTLSKDNLIKVYSNEDVVTIAFENNFNANAKVEIQNVIGQKVFAGTVTAEGTQTIQIEDVTTGYYFVSVEVEGEKLSSKVFLTKK